MHKDFYENIYGVVKGSKKFILIPPTEVWRIPTKKYPQGVYERKEDGSFRIEKIKDEPLLPWVSIDPLKPDLTKYPKYRDITRYEVDVEEGDLLYLPSLWFHHVQQSHGCIAVNYWFDMKFDYNYCIFQLLERLKSKAE